jgi:thymidylate kinase
VIAIVGGDGAGKTSVVQHLAEHYRAFVATKTFHLGKPRRSLISHVVRALHQANNGIRRRFAIRHDRKRTSGPQTAGLLLTLKHLCTGRDRYRNYGRACRFATEGGIAICDRWPLPGLKLMDAPKPLDALGFPAVNGFAGLLRAKECEFHQRVLRPDVLIVLRLHPDLAVARRTDEREDHVRPRSQEVWEFDWTRLNAHVTDSSQPLPDVVSQVIALSWKAL